MVDVSLLKKLVVGGVAACAVGGAVLAPHGAHAQYYAPGYYPPPPPRVVYAPPPPPVVVRPRPYYRHWVPAHYNRFGYFVPGHWV
jgi:hypothetical protein